MSHEIVAGTFKDVDRGAIRRWCVVDLGFSAKNKTCGIVCADDREEAKSFQDVRWSEVPGIIAKEASREASKSGNLGLVLEAPLSFSFDKQNNPQQRTIEKKEKQTRPWYCNGGATTFLSALFLMRNLLRDLHDLREGGQGKIYLFEGFCSFKTGKNRVKNHYPDALAIYEKIRDRREEAFYATERLKLKDDYGLHALTEFIGIKMDPPTVILS